MENIMKQINLLFVILFTACFVFADDPIIPGGDIPGLADVLEIAKGDIDGDDREDLAVLQSTPALSILLAQEGGGFGQPVTTELSASPSCLAIGPFNDDTHLDIAIGSATDRSVSIYFGDGAGGMTAGPVVDAAIEVASLAVSDMNGDGKVDITANSEHGSVVLLLSDRENWTVSVIDNQEPPPPFIIQLDNLPSDATPLEMVLVPAGTFTMGSPDDEQYRDSDEGPQHEVTITQPFYLGKYEVTQAQWRVVMGSNPSTDSSEASDYGTRGVGDDYPVYYVSWNDCQTFIENLNAMGQGTFRLPTEAEWEYACRAGTTTRYYWGDDPSYSEIDNYAWYSGNNSPNGTKVVGQKLPNAWGLFDMSGNLWEWCNDRYSSSYYSNSPATDPQGPTSGSYRVARGGNWSSYARYCRSAFRSYDSPVYRYNYIGVRLLRSHP